MQVHNVAEFWDLPSRDDKPWLGITPKAVSHMWIQFPSENGR